MLRRPSDLIATDLPVAHRPFGDYAAVEPLLALCRGGKLYEAEGWINDGRPIQFPPSDDRKARRRSTALQIAVKHRFHSLAALLLANGYDPNGDYYECLSSAVQARDRDMVDLLLRFGADPQATDFCSVLETCDRAIMDRFVEAGVDPCRDNAVARSLDFKGRPILGFIKQYRDRFPCLQRQIDIALHVFTGDGDLRGIALMLWVGADPHAATPASAEEDDGTFAFGDSAFQSALWSRKPEILTQFLKRPIPAEKLNVLLSDAGHHSRPDLVRRLLDEGADPNFSVEEGYPILYNFINGLTWAYATRTSEERERGFQALELLLKAGAKWTLDEQNLKGLRPDFAASESKIVIPLLELLRRYAAFTPEQLHELTRTPAVRKVLNGISRPRPTPFGQTYSPPPLLPPPVAATPRRGYWKRHWST
ncbi:MAG: hypothetical protein ABI222_05455 [Opitutaceae bacterium]